MFERFTERARQVVVLAQDEARGFKHNYIGTEHLLLGLLRVEEGLASRVLTSLHVTVDEVRAEILASVGSGDHVLSGQIPFSPCSRKVLDLALREALSLGHNYIGTEHILLGFARNTGGGVGLLIIESFNVSAEQIREAVITKLAAPPKLRSIDRPAKIRSLMREGKNPVPLYLTYKRGGHITPDEQRELTTEMIASLFVRLVQLESR